MKIIMIILSFTIMLNAGIIEKPTLKEAYSILQKENLEIKAATFDVSIAKQKEKKVNGKNWGKLDFIQDISRSNDAGNVFGFKLSSREATFGDFGAREFMNATGANGGTPPESAYTTPPHDLNYPGNRNYFQSKLRYEVPLFTGFALSSYSDIMKEMTKIKSLDRAKVLNEKRFELKKSYYNMRLLESSIANLNKIVENIERLESMTKSMIEVGYAKHVDLLEVQAKKGSVVRLLGQMKANKELLLHYISFLLNQKVGAITLPKSDVVMPELSDTKVLAQNLDIKEAESGLVVRGSMLSVKDASYYPTIGAFAEVATADNTFLGDANKHKSYTLGARLTWNLFSGGIDSAQIEEAKLENLKMQSQVALAKEGISLKLAKIHTEIKSSNDEIRSLTQELKLADTIYKNYEGRYKEKLTSMSDVIIKQSAQIQKVLELQIAKNKRNEKIFALEKLANEGK